MCVSMLVDEWRSWWPQVLAFLGGENEVRTHIDALIAQLIKVVSRKYQVTTTVRIKIILKFILGDHKALGIVLSHKMGKLGLR